MTIAVVPDVADELRQGMSVTNRDDAFWVYFDFYYLTQLSMVDTRKERQDRNKAIFVDLW